MADLDGDEFLRDHHQYGRSNPCDLQGSRKLNNRSSVRKQCLLARMTEKNPALIVFLISDKLLDPLRTAMEARNVLKCKKCKFRIVILSKPRAWYSRGLYWCNEQVIRQDHPDFRSSAVLASKCLLQDAHQVVGQWGGDECAIESHADGLAVEARGS